MIRTFSMAFTVLILFSLPAEARPARWCGWYMRTQVGHDPGPAYNLARNWTHYGAQAAGPAIGVIVVWPNHVGRIVGQKKGQWLVNSGNDSNAVRTRARSLRGAIAYRWPSQRLALK